MCQPIKRKPLRFANTQKKRTVKEKQEDFSEEKYSALDGSFPLRIIRKRGSGCHAAVMQRNGCRDFFALGELLAFDAFASKGIRSYS